MSEKHLQLVAVCLLLVIAIHFFIVQYRSYMQQSTDKNAEMIIEQLR